MKAHRFKMLDEDTGELVTYRAVPESNIKGQRFMIIEQDPQIYLSDRDIRGKTCRVWRYLTGKAKFQNGVPSISKTAKALNMPISNVSRAYKELIANYIIVKDKEDDTYLLNPHFYWKGTAKQRKDTIARLEKQGVKL